MRARIMSLRTWELASMTVPSVSAVADVVARRISFEHGWHFTCGIAAIVPALLSSGSR